MMDSISDTPNHMPTTEGEENKQGQRRNGNIDDIPPSASAYLNPQYWNERFETEEHYEWFKDYSYFRHLVALHVRPTDTDVLLVDSGDPWNPNPETVSKVNAMLTGVHRVLTPEGVFISISFGQPHFRRPLFEAVTMFQALLVQPW